MEFAPEVGKTLLFKNVFMGLAKELGTSTSSAGDGETGGGDAQ